MVPRLSHRIYVVPMAELPVRCTHPDPLALGDDPLLGGGFVCGTCGTSWGTPEHTDAWNLDHGSRGSPLAPAMRGE